MRGVALHGLETGFWKMMTKVPDRLSAHGSDLARLLRLVMGSRHLASYFNGRS